MKKTYLFVIILVLIQLSLPSFACHQYVLYSIDKQIDEQQRLLQKYEYNYHYLQGLKANNIKKKQELFTCQKTIENQLQNISKNIQEHQQLNLSFSPQEQQNFQKIQAENQQKIKFIQVSNAKIDNLMIIINDRIQYAKYYDDSRNHMKNLKEILESPDYKTPELIDN